MKIFCFRALTARGTTLITPNAFMRTTQLQIFRPAINLRTMATQPAATQMGKHVEHSSSLYHSPQVRHTGVVSI